MPREADREGSRTWRPLAFCCSAARRRAQRHVGDRRRDRARSGFDLPVRALATRGPRHQPGRSELPVVIFAALLYHQNGFVRLPVVATICGGFVVGAYLGARLLPASRPPVAVGLRWALAVRRLFFVLDIRLSRSAVALPAGVATLLAVVFGRLLRRRRLRRTLPPRPRPRPNTTYEA